MIERQFVHQKKKEFQIQETVASELNRVGHSKTKMMRTPLGEKIVIHASRPGLVVGRKGQSIKALTKTLKQNFKLDNPQIEINEVQDTNLDSAIVAERIANSLEMYGANRFKGVGHRVMDDIMQAGALGVEILITGKIPSSRSKRWRFYSGYLKKCGDIAAEGVKQTYAIAQLKTGVVGIQVRIMPPDVKLPDNIKLNIDTKVEEATPEETKEIDQVVNETEKKESGSEKEKEPEDADDESERDKTAE